MKKLFILSAVVLTCVCVKAQIVDVSVYDDCSKNGYTKVIDRAPAGVEMVDLGLSVKWANMNVGATKPEEYGDHFAWGETSPKTEYTWDTYKWMAESQSSWEYINKYTFPDGQTSASWYNGDTFIGDNKTVLDKEDDAASVNWGGNWRMPTHEELQELYDNCTTTWIYNYQSSGIAGRLFTSKIVGYTDKSIFLPAAGYSTETLNREKSGLYWSSSLYEKSSNTGWDMRFYSQNTWLANVTDRCQGFSVRPVCE